MTTILPKGEPTRIDARVWLEEETLALLDELASKAGVKRGRVVDFLVRHACGTVAGRLSRGPANVNAIDHLRAMTVELLARAIRDDANESHGVRRQG